ncbi:hypothetical protein BEH_05250 [Priestia filamentosa]|uniref:Uncharacterized protein n=1 Tax=Priestia filamentosa TaxID=1402861 RepID=A0A0H4KGX0_9BACI|nr:hypothetical protein BEH_05250 [Priestia filamentosa]
MREEEKVKVLYHIYILQFFIWCTFTFVEHLSHRDHLGAKAILFIVFVYLGYLIAEMYLKHKKSAFFLTAVSMITFFSMQTLLFSFF